MSNDWQNFINSYTANERIKHTSDTIPSPKEVTLPNGMTITLRLECEDDYSVLENAEVEHITRNAFWGVWEDKFEKLGGLGCDEHYLCRTLRHLPEFVPELDYVAVYNGHIVGNVMYTVGYIKNNSGEFRDVLNFGPLTVLPEFQGIGVGEAIMRHTIEVAKQLGYGGILFYGHPTYYPRLGFREAVEFGVQTHDGENFSAFMGMELVKGYLSEFGGRCFESPLMNVNTEQAIEFDKNFPPISRTPTVQPLNELHIPFLNRLMNKPEIVEALHTVKTSLKDWEEAYKLWQSDKDDENFIIYKYAKPIGWLKLNGFDNRDKAWISMLVILPEFQGKGFGGVGVDFAVDYIRQRGYKSIGIHTNEENVKAQKCYEKHGFHVTEKGDCTNGDGEHRIGYTYEMEL